MLPYVPAPLLNSSHRPEPYFEWFYFHFVTTDGMAINMVLHETDIFGLKQDPYLSLTALTPGRQPIYLKRDLPGNSIAKAQEFLQVGEGLIVESNEAIRFDIPLPGQGFFVGEITKLASPLMIQGGLLYEEPSTGRTSHWIVLVPHATFTQRFCAWMEQPIDCTAQHTWITNGARC